MDQSCRCIEIRFPEEAAVHLAAWRELQSRALDDNYYLSPVFITAAMRHYGTRHDYRVVLVYRGEQLIAVAPFSLHRPSLWAPLWMLRGMASPHGYLSHPLLDRDAAEDALRTLLDWFESPGSPWQLVFFPNLSAASPLLPILESELRRRGRAYRVQTAFQRAALARRENFDAYLAALPAVRRKTFNRRWRKLERSGKIEVLLHRNTADAAALAHRFMEVERKSWKGARGSALGSASNDSAFFTEIVRDAAGGGNLFFVELLLDGRTIAITANFVCGATLFAFKIAYDPAYGEHSPGTLAELMTVKLFHETPELVFGDAGADEGSYVSAYWRDLVPMRRVLIAMPMRAAEIYLSIADIADRAKRVCANLADRVRHWVILHFVLDLHSVEQGLQGCCIGI